MYYLFIIIRISFNNNNNDNKYLPFKNRLCTRSRWEGKKLTVKILLIISVNNININVSKFITCLEKVICKNFVYNDKS